MSRVENWAPSTQDGAVLNQPYAVKNENPSAANESYPGGVTIRTLRDDVEDAEFAARLLVDAFRGKFVHAVGENKYVVFCVFTFFIFILILFSRESRRG